MLVDHDVVTSHDHVQKVIRPIVTSSSGLVLTDTIATGARVVSHVLRDPADVAVIEALVTTGSYSRADAVKIVDACSTRLGFLEDALNGPSRPSADALIAESTAAALMSFIRLRAKQRDEEFKAVARLLDDITAAEAHGDAWPAWSRISAAATASGIERVVFVEPDARVTFHSRVHARVWRQHRNAIMAQAETVQPRPASGLAALCAWLWRA